MTDQDVNIVGALLHWLSPDEVADMAAYGTRRQIEPGEVIQREGAPVDGFHVIDTGRAEVTVKGPKGESRLLATLGRGDAIGEMGLLTDNSASATVTAATPMVIVSYGHTEIGQVLAAYPAIELALGRVVARRLARSQRRFAGHDARVVHVVSSPVTDRQLAALAASAAWHARRPVLALVPGGTASHDDVVRECRSGVLAPRGRVVAVDPTVLASLPQLAEDLAGAVAAVIALVPSTMNRADGHAVATIAELPALAPNRADGEAIADGLLPPTSPYGAALGRAGRTVIGRRVGVAFGAGSARGFAHAGVIDVLAKAGVPIDAVAGTSIGSVAAGLVALGRDGDSIIELIERAGSLVLRPRPSKSSLFSMRPLARYLSEQAGDMQIEGLEIPTGIVAADLDSGEEVVFRRGLLITAVMASIAIPGVYPPQHVSGRRLIDGAFVNPVPADVVAGLGADVVIAVKLATRVRSRVELSAAPTSGPLPWAPQVILRSVDMMSNAVSRALPSQASVVIEPTFAGAGGSLADFRKGGARFRAEGRRATESVLDELRLQLAWLGP
jgi:NTE family protein